MYDVKCDELARAFLEDDGPPTEEDVKQLAQAIQDCIEDWMERP
jgi:hypothetical protein